MDHNEVVRMYEIRIAYQRMVDAMTLKAYAKIMGGSMHYAQKAERAKQVTRSRKVHALADRIIALSSGSTQE